MKITGTRDLTAARQAAIAQIDFQSEQARARLVTPGVHQQTVYSIKLDEARRVQAGEKKGHYPMLEASIPHEGSTVKQVAELVIKKHSEMVANYAAIESDRAARKAAVLMADTPSAIQAVVDQ